MTAWLKFSKRKKREVYSSELSVITIYLKNSLYRDIIPMLNFLRTEDNMAVTYKKLFRLLIHQGIQDSELIEKAGGSPNILKRLRRDQYVLLDSIVKICIALNCKVDDILEFVQDDKSYKLSQEEQHGTDRG